MKNWCVSDKSEYKCHPTPVALKSTNDNPNYQERIHLRLPIKRGVWHDFNDPRNKRSSQGRNLQFKRLADQGQSDRARGTKQQGSCLVSGAIEPLVQKKISVENVTFPQKVWNQGICVSRVQKMSFEHGIPRSLGIKRYLFFLYFLYLFFFIFFWSFFRFYGLFASFGDLQVRSRRVPGCTQGAQKIK